MRIKSKKKKEINNTFVNGGENDVIFIFNSTRKHVLTYKIRYIPTSVWYIRKESAENVSTVGVISAEKGERKFKSDSQPSRHWAVCCCRHDAMTRATKRDQNINNNKFILLNDYLG